MKRVYYHLAFVVLALTNNYAIASDSLGSDGFLDGVNNFFGAIVSGYAPVLFYELPFIKLPMILFVMVSGGIFFTFRYGFINIRLFKHSIDVIRGHYDDPNDEGEISHFQALTSALSATVGLGNIAGVAVAIQVGGPGAVFWLWLVAFFGMSMKFTSCSFAQYYRRVNSDGSVLGGPMVYLEEAFKEKFNLVTLGKGLGIFYAVMTIMALLAGAICFKGIKPLSFSPMSFHPFLISLLSLVLSLRFLVVWFF